MFTPIESEFLVSGDDSFDVKKIATEADSNESKKELKKKLNKYVDELDELQELLYAHNKYSVLLVFQAMDAAGKDSTIRAVLRGVNPAGCQVHSFKMPSENELDHDFLWRTTKALPERGRIGVFNRSYYEEVLVVKVHPQILDSQRLPFRPGNNEIWKERYESIRSFEQHMARSGTLVLKFWLNVSREQQRERFLDRLNKPHKNWKFSRGDLSERALWDDYMDAYQDALRETSRPWAPWFAIPADNKPFMRAQVARIIVHSLRNLDMSFPEVSEEQREEFAFAKNALESGEV
jgi:PPK2 family polyphosphate:nucleotide phosphotransferase